jgi:hypothetical protein
VSYPASGASMLHAQVCALERLHTLTLVARPKTAPRRQGLPLRAYVPRSCVCTSVPTHLESRSISEDSATTAGFGPAQMPGAGAPHLYSRSTSKTVPDGRACAPVSVCSTLWCVHFSAHMHTHLSILVAHQRQRHDGGACPLRACVPRSGVCASNHTHLYSRSTSKTVPRRQGLPPASVCSTLGGVNFSARTSLFSRHVKDRATTAGLAPCERGSPAQV